VFRLKYPTSVFLPALADPFTYIYKKEIIDKDPRWYEKNVMGSGPFKMINYEAGQAITGERNPDYYHQGLPYLDKIVGILAPKQATRLDAIRADRGAIEFRGLPPSARDELVNALGDKITVQESDWNCSLIGTPNHKKKPFDDVRVRRALTLAIDRWGSAAPLSKIAIMRTVGGIVFPGSPLAATKQELEKIAGFWPDIEKSRTEAKRLLKEAGAEGTSFELLNRNVDQPFKYLGTWFVDQWSKVGLKVTQRVEPTGPWYASLRSGNFDVALEGNCQGVINPVLDVSKYQPPAAYTEQYGQFEDAKSIDLYQEMLHEVDPAKQRELMRAFERHTLDDQAHEILSLWWYRLVPHRSYVKGWKIGPSHFLNQDLAMIWLDQ
jgi:peptide/nickel transport system substrate-binding protein